MEQCSLSKKTIREDLNFPETGCSVALSPSLDISEQRQKGAVVVGKESHLAHSQLLHMSDLWGSHGKNSICLLILHLQSITQGNRTARSLLEHSRIGSQL